MTKKPRLMLTITKDIISEVKEIKKVEPYFDKPYSELYRDLICIGINALKRQRAEN